MTLFVYICNKPDKLEEILEGFLEIGITGATIIDSLGMGHVLEISCGLHYRASTSRHRGIVQRTLANFSLLEELFTFVDGRGWESCDSQVVE